MKAYYAHSKKIYGTKVEKTNLACISQLYKEVVNPRDMGELGAIDPYLRAIDSCDEVVCTEYEGYIGRGVYDEIRHTLKMKKPVYLFRRGEFIVVLAVKIADVNDWAVRYGKVVTNISELGGNVWL